MTEISTKPYMLRAIYEWCTDNGYTPYIAVKVNQFCQVPMAFVKNGEIVLNVSFGATKGMKFDNDAISFSARFGGVARDIYVPVDNVLAIYASENGQGMAFDVRLDAPASAPASGPGPVPTPVPAAPTLAVAPAPTLAAAPAPLASVSSGETSTESDGDTPTEPDNTKKTGRPTLTRVK
jgi:stringent starvation protein B